MTTATTLDGVLLFGVAASRPAASAVAKGTIYSATDTGAITQSDGVSTWSAFATIPGSSSNPQYATIELGNASDTTLSRASAGVVAVEGTNLVKAGAATGSGITMATARLLGRTTASSGAIEEITVGTGLSLSAGSLTATAAAASGILAVKAYAPASQTIYSATSLTIADVDATNMAVTFTAPASGNIIVRLSAYADISAGTGDAWWGLREASSNIAASQVRVIRNQGNAVIATANIYLTGVSAGSHTYKWAFRSASGAGDTTRIIIQDGSNGTWGPGVMIVEAAP